MSKNDSVNYRFQFEEQDAYTESVLKKSVENIQNFTKNNTNAAYWLGANYRENKTTEKESSFGMNLEYDFNLFNKISGKIKTGFKSRNKRRDHDQNQE